MDKGYLWHRLTFLVKTYPVRLVRLFNWPVAGCKRLFHYNSPNRRNLVIQVAGWWLGMVFLLLDLLLAGDVYELVSRGLKKPRPLSRDELEFAKKIFGTSIRFELVRLDERARLGCKNKGIAYVSLFTINSWGVVSSDTLIHELMHVWQYQKMGLAYIPLALLAQRSSEGYSYNGPKGLKQARKAGFKLSSFNLEQQAEIIAGYASAIRPLGKSRQPGPDQHVSDLEHFASQLHQR